MEPSGERLTYKECDFCKEALRVVEYAGHRTLIEVASGSQHVCWENLPHDANLLVMDD